MTNEEKLAFIKENYLFSRKLELSVDKGKVIAEWEKSILSSIPRNLYKYRVCNDNNLNALKNKKAWFSDPNTWNDPVDVTVLYNLEEDIKHLDEHFDDYVVKFAFSFINKYIESFCEQKKFVTAEEVKSVYYSVFKDDGEFKPEKMISYLEPVVGWKPARQITVKTQEALIQAMSPEFKERVLNDFKQFLGFNEIKNEVLMYSLSETFENNHQWAMYADGGKGFCIGYKLKINNPVDESLVRNLLPIYYGEKRELKLFKMLDESLEYYIRHENLFDLLNQETENLYVSLYTKAPEWNGEQEWRFAIMKFQLKSNLVDFDYADSLFLGENISDEWKLKLIEIAKNQNLKVYQRKLDKMKSKWIYEPLKF